MPFWSSICIGLWGWPHGTLLWLLADIRSSSINVRDIIFFKVSQNQKIYEHCMRFVGSRVKEEYKLLTEMTLWRFGMRDANHVGMALEPDIQRTKLSAQCQQPQDSSTLPCQSPIVLYTSDPVWITVYCSLSCLVKVHTPVIIQLSRWRRKIRLIGTCLPNHAAIIQKPTTWLS